MGQPSASYLRLHVEPPPPSPPASLDSIPGIAGLCRAFDSATGWRLTCQPASQKAAADPVWTAALGDGRSTVGELCLSRARGESDAAPSIDQANASRLAAALAELMNAKLAAETALWQREAELAACVPVVSRSDEGQHLAARLEAILKAAAEALECQAAGLYVLDADTTQLKLRSAWGLPHLRLLEPPRLLSAAIGDLEALAGHAVVLEKAALAEVWSLPEAFPAALCVPVSTPAVPLGTMWLFSKQERPFSDAELNIAEVVAGRLAAELEREILLADGQQFHHYQRQLARARDLQEGALRRPTPLIEGFEVGGWALQSQQLGGAWFDWMRREDGLLTCAVGEAQGVGVAAALIAQTAGAALAAHGEQSGAPDELLQRINHTLWRQSAGDQFAGLCLATLDAAEGMVRSAWAGCPALLHVRRHSYELLFESAAWLGAEPEAAFPRREIVLQPGEALVLCTPSLGRVIQQPGHRLNTGTLATLMIDHLDESAVNLAELVRSCCESQAIDLDQVDRGALVIKRK
jgi:hypothetical protein